MQCSVAQESGQAVTMCHSW